MVKNSPLKTQMMKSSLAGMSVLAGTHQGKKKKNLSFSLNLTTLIDAFCILVIFLLSNMNGQAENVDVSQKISLPQATKTEIMKMGTVIKIENEVIFVDNVKTTLNSLVSSLIAAKKNKTAEDKESLIIQADKNADFDVIGDLIRAGGQAGFSKYLFAVLPGA